MDKKNLSHFKKQITSFPFYCVWASQIIHYLCKHEGTSLNSLQEEYVKTITTYVCQNGDSTLENLVNTKPFSEYEWIDTFGQSFMAVRNFVNKVHQVIAYNHTLLNISD